MSGSSQKERREARDATGEVRLRRLHPDEAYIAELRDIYASGAGVAETSCCPALAALLNEVGKALEPELHPAT